MGDAGLPTLCGMEALNGLLHVRGADDSRRGESLFRLFSIDRWGNYMKR